LRRFAWLERFALSVSCSRVVSRRSLTLLIAAGILLFAAGGRGAVTLVLPDNGDFENGSTAGWVATGGSLQLISPGNGSAYAAHIAWAGSGSSYSLTTSTAPVTSTVAGTVYLGSGSVRSTDAPGKKVCLVLKELTSSGGSMQSVSVCTVTKATWVSLKQARLTAAHTGDRVTYTLKRGSVSSVESFDVDNLALASDETPPSQPQSFTAQPVAATEVDLSWLAASDPDDSTLTYKLSRCPGSAFTCSPATVLANSLSQTNFRDRTVSAGQTYTYGVLAHDEASLTSPLAQATATTPSSALPIPMLSSLLQDGQVTSATAAGFQFKSGRTGSSFVCSVDGAPATPCTTPQNYFQLAAGRHTFSVSTTDGSGNLSPPASLSWTIAEPTSASPCGSIDAPPASYMHVIVIVLENENYSDIIGGTNTPYTTALANQCGQATNDYALARPSLPNYIALTSGSTQGISDDKLPSYHPLAVDNLFNQSQTAGMSWREYSSQMPSNCYGGANSSFFVVHHEPALYYTDLAASCPNWAVPLGTTTVGALASDLDNNTLPGLAWIGPADDGGDKALGGEVDPLMGDFFLKDWIARIVASPAYTSGSTAIVITWDEGDFTHASTDPAYQNVPLIVLAPSIRPGSVTTTRFTHYAVLRAIESMLGLPLLGQAADSTTADLRAALGF
jgi:hypothetical protein